MRYWNSGSAIDATCDAGDPAPPQVFSCNIAGSTLSWDDAGASTYYLFSTTGGIESYLGGFTGTSTDVGAADSYRVRYWMSGSPTDATCSP